MGNSSTPTEINVSVINQDGVYTVTKPNYSNPQNRFGSLSCTNTLDIQIVDAGGSPVRMFNDFSLVNFNISTSVGQKTLQLKFVDKSIILDKIQVALLGENVSKFSLAPWQISAADMVTSEMQGVDTMGHYDKNNANPYPILQGQAAEDKKLKATINYRCPSCDLTKKEPEAIAPITRSYISERGFISNIDPMLGGFLAIGTEEYASTDCQLKNVSYNWNELTYALGRVGINIEGIIDKSLVNQRLRGEHLQPQGLIPYRQKHVGTLREVLNSWCSDFGYTWVLDQIFTNRIVGIDLSRPVVDLEEVTSLANRIGEGSKLALESINENFSIENTYAQYHTSTFRRPARTKQITTKVYERRSFSNVRIEELIPCELYGPRNIDEFITSCVLAKFNKEARTLYNWMLCRNCENLETLGISLKYKLTTDEKEKLINLSYSNKDAFDKSEKYGPNADVWIGTYSQELENKWVDYENLVAEFLGRWYKIEQVPEDSFQCGKPQFSKTFELTTSPSSEQYDDPVDPNTGQVLSDDFPFSDLLTHPSGAKLKANFPIRLFSRNPVYGTKEEEIEDIFKDADGASVLQEHIPQIEFIEGTTRANLYDVLAKTFPNTIGESLDKMKDKERPALIFAPEVAVLEKHIKVGKLEYGAINLKEKMAQDKKESEDDKDCELMCDEDPIIDLCDDLCKDKYPAYAFGKYTKEPPPQKDVRLSSVKSWSFDITTNENALDTGTKKIILPSLNDHYGYLTYSSEIRQTISSLKQTFGFLGNAGETMGLQLNAVDITSDIEGLSNETTEGEISPPMIIVPKFDEKNSAAQIAGLSQALMANEYHEKTKLETFNDLAEETVDFTFSGDIREFIKIFGPYLSAQTGLTSLSVSVKDDGQTISAAFSTKPANLPKHDIMVQKMSSNINVNTFGRTF
jgi:hypothetical protein